GVEVAATVDLRAHDPSELSAEGRGGVLRSVTVDGERHDCDLLIASGAPQPAYSLLAQAGARIVYDAGRGVFVPTELPPGVAAVGTTTARPPWAPVTLGLLAGRTHEPAKRTAIHHRHEEGGATIMWTGAWRRPHSYGDAPAEAQNVHKAVGVIDVSTLGKLLV